MITKVRPFISANDDYSSKKSPFISFVHLYNPQSAIMQCVQRTEHSYADKVN